MVRAGEALESRVTGPIVFVAADPRECEPWIATWNSIARLRLPVHWARKGEWKGRSMIAIANGAGAERAYAAAMAVANAAQIWNIGFGGAADPALRIADIVVADRVCSNGGSFVCARPSAALPFRTGCVRTIAAVAQTADEKSIHRKAGASVVEMEAAGAARAALELRTPFYCVRAVSDLACEDFVNDFNTALRPDGRFSAARLLVGAAKNPRRRFAELIRLQKRTALAAKNLGDFLAHCEY